VCRTDGQAPEKRHERDQHERAPQQAEGNQATQHSVSIVSAIDSPQIDPS